MTNAELKNNIERAKEIVKNGNLIATASDGHFGWNYWVYNGVMYSISAYNHHYDIWCSVERLRAHCLRLEQVTGKKFFADGGGMVIIDRDFVAQYC